MEASNLEQGELYVCREYPSDRVSPIFQRLYAGQAALYLGYSRYAHSSARYKFLINGKVRLMPESFLRHMDLPDV